MEYQKTYDKIFKALENGDITEEQAEDLRGTLFEKTSDRVFEAKEAGHLTEEQAIQLQEKLNGHAGKSLIDMGLDIFDQRSKSIMDALDAGDLTMKEAEELQIKLGDTYAPTVSDEMHPEISAVSRAVYKNFSADPAAGLAYLKKENPHLRFRKDPSGAVLAKAPGEVQWGRVDEKGFGIQDISDVGYDVGAGLTEGAATAAGGLFGAGMGAPAGPGMVMSALGTGALAGGLTGGGLETLRQAIGSGLGIDQGLDPDQIKTAAMFGAVSPLLMGTGGVVKAGARGASKKLIGSAAENEARQAAQSGVFGQIKQNIAPWIGERASGVQARYLKRGAKDIATGELDAFNSLDALDNVRETVLGAVKQQKKDKGKEIGDIVRNYGDEVNIEPVKEEFVPLFEEYIKRAENLGTESARDDLEFLAEAFRKHIPEHNILRGEDAVVLKRGITHDLTRAKKKNPAGFDTQHHKLSPAEKDLARVSTAAANKMDDVIANNRPELLKLNKEYKSIIDGETQLQKLFKDRDTTKMTLERSLGGKKSDNINDVVNKTGIDIENIAEGMVAADIFKDPSSKILSVGSSPTGRSNMLQFGGMAAGGALGTQLSEGEPVGGMLGTALGAMTPLLGSPSAMKAMMKANKYGRDLNLGLRDFSPGLTGGRYVPNVQSGVNIWKTIKRREEEGDQ